MEIKTDSEYISNIFAMNNPKKDRLAVFDPKGIARLFVHSILGKDKVEKVYYDTPDLFFANRGVDIYTVTSKVKKMSSLHIKLSSNATRYMFLSDMPTYSRLDIPMNANIKKYGDFIVSSLYKIFPNGLGVNPADLVLQLRPRVDVIKDRELFRFFNNDGLKVILSFDKVTYINHFTRIKDKVEQFEIALQSARFIEDYDSFVHRMSMQVTNLIPRDPSDLVNALMLTNFKKNK